MIICQGGCQCSNEACQECQTPCEKAGEGPGGTPTLTEPIVSSEIDGNVIAVYWNVPPTTLGFEVEFDYDTYDVGMDTSFRATLIQGKTYTICVTAYNDTQSATTCITVGLGITLPTPIISKREQTTNSVTIDVSATVPGLDHYETQYRDDVDRNWVEYWGDIYEPIIVTDLNPLRIYDFRVRSVKDDRKSNWSNILTVSMSAQRPPDWEWEYPIYSGAEFYDQIGNIVYLMRAGHWDEFTNTINLFRKHKQMQEINFTRATRTTSDAALTSCINEAIDAVNEMTTHSNMPRVYKGDPITAAIFTGLRDRLNSI